MEELQEFSEKEESNFDLKAEIYKYLTHWKWLVFGCLIGLGIAYLYNRYTIPNYLTEATMMILKDEDKNVASALPSGGQAILAFSDNSLENQIVSLQSRSLVETVVDELNLNIFYFIEGNVISIEAYKNSPIQIEFLSDKKVVNNTDISFSVIPQNDNKFTLNIEALAYSQTHAFGEALQIEDVKFKILKRPGPKLTSNTVKVEIRPLTLVAKDYISKMEIKPMGKANDILSLAISGEVPEKSQDFLNSLMFHFNAEGVSDKRQVAENTAEFIQKRLSLISEELDSVEGGIAKFKRDNRMMSVESSAGQYLAKSSAAEQQIFDLETQLLIIEGIQETLSSAEPYQLLPEISGTESGVSSGVSKYNDLVLERRALLKTGTTENPVVETLTEQLNGLKSNLLSNIEQTKNSIRIKLREFNQLDRQAEGTFSTFPGLEKGIRSIERQQQIKEQLYLFLLQRREESAISSAATSPVAKVIDPAWTFEEPVDPKPGLILAGGGIIGLLIPLLVIFGINFLDTKVHHKGDLQPLIKNTPFLGEVPRVQNEENEVIQLNDRSPLAESFRILRTNLAYLVQSRNREKAEVIFVTSTIKGEGKTFISFNLSRTLASTGKRVLIIGADIRNPKLHKFSQGTLETKGLSDYLYNYDIQSQEIIHTTNQGNIPVDLIFSGAIPPNPAELLMNDRMKGLLKSQENNYDYIIVDTAPTMIVTDTLLISPLADTTIYVTRSGFTEKKLLDFPKDLKQQGKLKGLAVVLNDVDYSKFSYGAKYGYSYGYGYG
ncbi:MAG: polysaccharide biosynthesis tyrosine autokinase, partial [Salinimicrobium sp.]